METAYILTTQIVFAFVAGKYGNMSSVDLNSAITRAAPAMRAGEEPNAAIAVELDGIYEEGKV